MPALQSSLATASAPARALLAVAALVAAAVAMGASPLFVRLAEVGPYASAFWRVALALPLLWLWARLERRPGALKGVGSVLASKDAGENKPSPPPEPSWNGSTQDWAVILAGLAFAGDLFFWHLAIFGTTIANATLLATLAPVWVMLLSGLLIGERVTAPMVAGLVLCLSGAAFLVGASLSLAPERLLGDLYGLVTSLFFGLYFLAVRAARRGVPPGLMLLRSTLVTAAALLVVAAVMENDWWPERLGGAAALIALAAISHVGGQGLLAFALGHLSAGFSSLVIFLEALAAALLAWIFLGEPVGPVQALGGAAILGGVFVARPKQEEPAP